MSFGRLTAENGFRAADRRLKKQLQPLLTAEKSEKLSQTKPFSAILCHFVFSRVFSRFFEGRLRQLTAEKRLNNFFSGG
jgi:hypothetical protein